MTIVTTASEKVYVEWRTATDSQSSPVTYLVYLDRDDWPWDGEVVEKTADQHFHTFTGPTPGYWWVGVRARDSANPPNIDQNEDVWGVGLY